ncbi:immunity 8 family protein [Vagococcus sp. WN89Y]|uniref:immunity 8 family protein n=1 Tax=Vagococcus sp. WN89Y TaxID=3457258 RepID=UPI003FCE2305
MKAILKNISNDDHDLDKFYPEDENSFSIRLLLRIGSENSVGADNFDLHVCTPEWLCKHQWLPELMRHTLLVRKYDLDEITKTITNYIDQCEGSDWMEIAQKLSRVFAWEFEDYQP